MTQNVDEPYIQKALKPSVSLSSRLRILSLEMRTVAHEIGLQRGNDWTIRACAVIDFADRIQGWSKKTIKGGD